MSATHTLALAAVGLLLVVCPLEAQNRSGYRDFQLGSDLRSVSAQANVAPAEAKTIHQRPAVMQELVMAAVVLRQRNRPRHRTILSVRSSSASTTTSCPGWWSTTIGSGLPA